MYQSRPRPTTSDVDKPTNHADSNTATEHGTNAVLNQQGPWVVDTVTLAEYEAQLKSQSESGAHTVKDPKVKAGADAYLDRFSDEEIDARVVSSNAETLDAVGDSTIQHNPNAVPGPESSTIVDILVHPEHQTTSIAQAESLDGLVDDSMAGAELDADSNTFPAEAIDTEIKEAVVVDSHVVSDSVSFSTDAAEAIVVEASPPHLTAASNTDLSTPVLIAVSLALPLLIILLKLNFAKLISCYSRRRENRFLQRSQNAQEPLALKTEEDSGVVSLKKDVDLRTQREASAQQWKDDGSFKQVTHPKCENKLSAGSATSNLLLESELLNAQESLALVKANSQRRDSELQAKVKGLNEQLSAQTDALAKLESDFLTSQESLAAEQASAAERAKELTACGTSQTEEDKIRAELLSEVERLKEELSVKTTAFSKLESDFLASEETLVAAEASAAERAKELLVDLELLGDELSAQKVNVTKFEADLIRTKKTLNSHKDFEKEFEAEQRARGEAFEKQINIQTDAIAKLESDLLKSEESLAAAQIKNESRANEFQAKIELLEEELNSKASTSAEHEADLLKAERELADRAADEQQRNAELQTKSDELEQELRKQTATFSELNSKLLNTKTALAAAQAKHSQRENEWQTNIDRLEAELKTEKTASKKLEAEMLEMKEALEDQQTSQTRQSLRTAELQADLTHAEQELEQLRLELNKEKATVAESVEKLASSRLKVSRLSEERSNAAVNRSNYMKLAKKVVHYKKLYRANEEKLKDLAEQNIGMSDLASEYLNAADGMIAELSEQAKLVAELKTRMLQSERISMVS